MRDINIYALDNQLNMIAILKPTNIQWSRKYYENGYFSILFLRLQLNVFHFLFS